MKQDIARKLMMQALEVAQMSEKEDDRIHPKVGAVLCDRLGNGVLYSFRVEGGSDGHAEFNLLERTANEGVASASFSTLILG